MTEIATRNAPLPVSYERAKTALAKCASMDECQKWADKAEALASYARQADDDSLRKMADRIQARAIRRCGELLKLVEPAKNQHDANARVGTDPSRSAAATSAGLSERQRKTALRVANIPESDFEDQVESDNPPTVTKLAEQGKVKRVSTEHLNGADPDDFYNATHAMGAIRRMHQATIDYPAESVAKGINEKEALKMKEIIPAIDAWLDTLITRI